MLGNMLTKDEVEDFMREADVVRFINYQLKTFRILQFSFVISQDGNGKLDYDEFVKMMLMY